MLDDIGHQDGEQFRHSIDTGGIRAIASGPTDDLAGLPCVVYPLPRYRVYDVEDA